MTPFFAQVEALATGFTDFLTKCGGGSFGRGLYRVHTSEGIQKWTAIVQDTFPKYRNQVMCFGYDWLGRQFALHSADIVNGQAQVRLFEPGFHKVLVLPCSFDAFHRTELPEYPQDVAAATFHAEWLSAGGGVPSYTQCVGYRIPPTLGGKDDISNLEVIDMDVYWTMS